MKQITFITGNQDKADYLARYLGMPLEHIKLDLDEIQSLDLKKVVKHKAEQAYEIIKRPVLIEDVSVEFKAFGRLPGPFIKFFLEEMNYEELCRLVDGKDRSFIAKCMYGFYDGQKLQTIEGQLTGTIADHPSGENGFGWDKIVILDGDTKTRASLTDKEYEPSFMKIRPVDKLKRLLEQL